MSKEKEKIQIEWSGGIGITMDMRASDSEIVFNTLFENAPSSPSSISFEEYKELCNEYFRKRDNATDFEAVPYETIDLVDEYLDFNKYNPPSIDLLPERTKKNLIETMNKVSPKNHINGAGISTVSLSVDNYKDLFKTTSSEDSMFKLFPMIQVKANGTPVPFSSLPEETVKQITEEIINKNHSGRLEIDKPQFKHKFRRDGIDWTFTNSDKPGLYFVEAKKDKELITTDAVKGPIVLEDKNTNHNKYLKFTKFFETLVRNETIPNAVNMDMTIEDYQKSLHNIDLDKYKDTKKAEVQIYLTRFGSNDSFVKFLVRNASRFFNEEARNEKNIEKILNYKGKVELSPTVLNEATKQQIKLNMFTAGEEVLSDSVVLGSTLGGYNYFIKAVLPADVPNNKEVAFRALDAYFNDETAKLTDGIIKVEVDISDLIENEINKLAKNVPITEITDCEDFIEGYFVFDNKEYGFDFDIASQEITLHNYDSDSYNFIENKYTIEIPLPDIMKEPVIEDAIKDEIDMVCTNYLLNSRGKEELDKIIASAEEKQAGIKSTKAASKDEMEL